MNRRNFIKASMYALGAACFSPVIGKAAVLTPTTGSSVKSVPFITLNNGKSIPQVGFGTYTLKNNATDLVRIALQNGYRLIDSAQAYHNEAEVFEGIRQSGVNRQDIFITTKVSPKNMRSRNTRAALEQSFKDLGGDYIDLVLIHFPIKGEGHIKAAWQVMEEFVDNGKVRSIGISNFGPQHLDDLLSYARIKPVLNQIEIHPYFTQEEKARYTRSKGIAVQGWSPFGAGVNNVLGDKTLTALAEKYRRSVAQIILRWNIQQDILVIPRSTNPAHIAENLNIYDFELSATDMATISALNKNEQWNPTSDPDVVPWE